MPQLNDCKFNALVDLGFVGSIDDMELQFLQSIGATSNHVNDAWVQVAGGGQFNDAVMAWMIGEGAVGFTLTDVKNDYWCNVAGVPPLPSDFNGNYDLDNFIDGVDTFNQGMTAQGTPEGTYLGNAQQFWNRRLVSTANGAAIMVGVVHVNPNDSFTYNSPNTPAEIQTGFGYPTEAETQLDEWYMAGNLTDVTFTNGIDFTGGRITSVGGIPADQGNYIGRADIIVGRQFLAANGSQISVISNESVDIIDFTTTDTEGAVQAGFEFPNMWQDIGPAVGFSINGNRDDAGYVNGIHWANRFMTALGTPNGSYPNNAVQFVGRRIESLDGLTAVMVGNTVVDNNTFTFASVFNEQPIRDAFEYNHLWRMADDVWFMAGNNDAAGDWQNGISWNAQAIAANSFPTTQTEGNWIGQANQLLGRTFIADNGVIMTPTRAPNIDYVEFTTTATSEAEFRAGFDHPRMWRDNGPAPLNFMGNFDDGGAWVNGVNTAFHVLTSAATSGQEQGNWIGLSGSLEGRALLGSNDVRVVCSTRGNANEVSYISPALDADVQAGFGYRQLITLEEEAWHGNAEYNTGTDWINGVNWVLQQCTAFQPNLISGLPAGSYFDNAAALVNRVFIGSNGVEMGVVSVGPTVNEIAFITDAVDEAAFRAGFEFPNIWQELVGATPALINADNTTGPFTSGVNWIGRNMTSTGGNGGSNWTGFGVSLYNRVAVSDVNGARCMLGNASDSVSNTTLISFVPLDGVSQADFQAGFGFPSTFRLIEDGWYMNGDFDSSLYVNGVSFTQRAFTADSDNGAQSQGNYVGRAGVLTGFQYIAINGAVVLLGNDFSPNDQGFITNSTRADVEAGFGFPQIWQRIVAPPNESRSCDSTLFTTDTNTITCDEV